MTWSTVAHVSTGTLHQQLGIGCQDFATVTHQGDWVAGFIADGAGSAPYGAQGAELAVKIGQEFICSTRWDLQDRSWLSLTFAQSYFAQVLQTIVAALTQEAQWRSSSIEDFASTLIVFVGIPQGLMAMQVGDGFLIVSHPSRQFDLVFQPSKGEHANETTFITSETAITEMQIQVLKAPLSFICAGTDGLERVAIRYSDWQPFSGFFQPLEECVKSLPPLEAQAYVQAFLASERLNSRTSDDKAIVLCHYQA